MLMVVLCPCCERTRLLVRALDGCSWCWRRAGRGIAAPVWWSWIGWPGRVGLACGVSSTRRSCVAGRVEVLPGVAELFGGQVPHLRVVGDGRRALEHRKGLVPAGCAVGGFGGD